MSDNDHMRGRSPKEIGDGEASNPPEEKRGPSLGLDIAPPDQGIQRLREIREEFEAFLASAGDASEADTRVKLIDRVLVEGCGWAESAIRREHHVHSGFLDYELRVHNRTYVAVEAKRGGKAFVFPHDVKHRSLKLSGALLSNAEIREAIQQVRRSGAVISRRQVCWSFWFRGRIRCLWKSRATAASTGGIGSGKTTFLKRYQRTVGAQLLEERTVWFHIDFLRAPLDPWTWSPLFGGKYLHS